MYQPLYIWSEVSSHSIYYP